MRMERARKHSAKLRATTSNRISLSLGMILTASRAGPDLKAATSVIYTNNFESYTAVATSEADTSDADPTGTEWNIADDTALVPTIAGAGVQVINWLTNSSGGPTKSL